MIDESTDISVTKQLAICIRFLTKDGRIAERLLAFKSLTGCAAADIAECVRKVLGDLGLPGINCCALGADGATVMSGKDGGAQQYILLNPFMQYVWCRAHCLNLACISAVEDNPRIETCMNDVRELWVFFKASSGRLTTLAEMQHAANTPLYKLIEPTDTRWLSNHLSLESVVRDLPNLFAALTAIYEEGKSGSATAAGLLQAWRRPYTIAGTFMMRDATGILSRFSKILQAKRTSLIQINELKATY
eukprot:gene58123-biopygen97929